MNEWNEQEVEEFAVVDAALRRDPLAPVPPTLAPAVMGRIEKLTRAHKFQLLWIDYALGVFGVALAAVLILLWQGMLPFGLVDLVQLSLLPHDVQSTLPMLLSLVVGLVLLTTCVAIALIVLKPRPAYRARV